MPNPWTTDLVLGLAPDAASAKAGRGQAGPGKWTGLGAQDTVLWGEVQGSGQKPYQVRVDLGGPVFKCSCPSRKFPCKHALGLMLIYGMAGRADQARRAAREKSRSAGDEAR